ncbi:MAG: VacJ family lipoprotein [Sphingomonadales bacterium]|nr:VacJ family lipoprotein [Sphingomonadales bacterium]MDE2568416.1 VacJ family lipoprotein [Sphingomonadales bacterium]
MILAAADHQAPQIEISASAPALPGADWSSGLAARTERAAALAGDPQQAAPAAPGTGSTPASAPDQPATPAPQDENAAAPIVVSGRPKEDPAMAINIQSYKAVQAVDGAFVRPVAMAYKAVLPGPARQGVHNVLTNLTEPVVFLNFLLQGKFGKALVVVGRFAVNTTIGVGGLMDVAAKKPFKLPYRKNNFADTLGFYGVGPGPYMFVPLVGPTTVRDLFGLLADKAVVPFSFGGPFKTRYYALGNGALSSLDFRVRYDDMITDQQNSADPYAAARKQYLDMRKAEVAELHTGKNAPKPEADEAKEASPEVPSIPVDAPQAGQSPQPRGETAPGQQQQGAIGAAPKADVTATPEAVPAPQPGPETAGTP